MRKVFVCCLVANAALSAQNVAAQSVQRMTTERPSFSTTPYVLSPGVWQIETGYHYTNDSDGADFELQTLPQALLRYGMSDDIELQFGWPGLSWRDNGNNSDSGMNDATIRVKIQVADESAATPMAFFAGLTLPVGDDEFSSDSYDPSIGAAWAHSRFFGTVLISKSDDDYTFENGLAMSFALKNDTSAYAEWQATVPEDGGSVHNLNGGILWLRRANMQLDLNASLGLNDRAADFSIGAGFSYRF
jgi:Putative MetA-pathway of phenol degradation